MSGQKGRIVVGVDGSDSSKAALRWAIRQAKLIGASVDAVIAWQFPSSYGWVPYPDGMPDLEGLAKSTLSAALAEVSDVEPDVLVCPVVAEGYAAGTLLDAAKGADLLVVGSQGHGGLTSALLESVGVQCVLHAHCPVLVFRDGREAPADRAS